ncbi:HNH endonuclease [Vibrio alginolyticus]|uniref:HNH endonuclease n=1 Tax=Vibrio alginolyticus TaxID=663 RepID=UPI001A8EC4AE|nr:HNH endonuclease signature motif containing protein [Vibrio alginolyticus]MBO0161558.1 HNH endonuclease [Vibrio alginolyticus]
MNIDVSFNKAGNISRLKTLADHLTESHILNAIAKYHKLHETVETYDESTTYDLVFDNKLYPPKAIFGLAMSELLGMQVKSSHFSAGLRSANFLTLERLGFEIRLKDGSPWSDEEMRDSVEAYLQMLQLDSANTKFNKAQIYRDLGNKFKRGAKSYEFRMQNISYVFELLERSWVKGLKPKRNITAQQVELIENLIADIENKPFEGKATFEAKVRESAKRPNQEKPKGDTKPKTSTSTTTNYARSPEVKAWILNRANGICECCNQEAPFETDEGKPFLEVHHIIPLVDGGADTVENCAGICPNCHRMLHFGKDRDAKFKLLQTKISQFEA